MALGSRQGEMEGALVDVDERVEKVEMAGIADGMASNGMDIKAER